MAELADAQASGACGSNIVRGQVPLPALFFCLCADLFSHISMYFSIFIFWFLFYLFLFPVFWLPDLIFLCFLFHESLLFLPDNKINCFFYQKSVDNFDNFMYSMFCRWDIQNFILNRCAGMAELADAQASGACGSNIVRVQVPLPALFFSSILPKSIWHCHSSGCNHRRSNNDSHPVQSWLHRMDILSPWRKRRLLFFFPGNGLFAW